VYKYLKKREVLCPKKPKSPIVVQSKRYCKNKAIEITMTIKKQFNIICLPRLRMNDGDVKTK
jgi:hypothetical protein